MVNLKLPDDGYVRNPSHGFIVIASTTKKYFTNWFEAFDRQTQGYEWGDQPIPKPFRNVLITPVTVPKDGKNLKYLKQRKEEGRIDNVMFDSGGFQVLTGSLEQKGISTLEDLMVINREIYNREDWADIYIMPDHPASRHDLHNALDPDHNSFLEKAKRTVEASLDFFEHLEPKIQGKVAPVFHLQRDTDIDFFFDAYRPILDKSKFASYSASSITPPGGTRQLTAETIRLVDLLLKRLKPEGIRLHCLGLAAPSAVFCMQYMGVTTYDASTPIVGAGLGKVFFPYFGSLTCSALRGDEATNLTQKDLDSIKRRTNHNCPFCQTVEGLNVETQELSERESIPGYIFRALHNLIILDELNWHYADFNLDKLKTLAPIMYKNFTSVLNLSNQMSFL